MPEQFHSSPSFPPRKLFLFRAHLLSICPLFKGILFCATPTVCNSHFTDFDDPRMTLISKLNAVGTPHVNHASVQNKWGIKVTWVAKDRNHYSKHKRLIWPRIPLAPHPEVLLALPSVRLPKQLAAISLPALEGLGWKSWKGKKMSEGTWGWQQAKLGEKTPPCQTSSYNITKPTMKGLCCRSTSADAAFALPHTPLPASRPPTQRARSLREQAWVLG